MCFTFYSPTPASSHSLNHDLTVSSEAFFSINSKQYENITDFLFFKKRKVFTCILGGVSGEILDIDFKNTEKLMILNMGNK